jgi:hypothetical protein
VPKGRACSGVKSQWYVCIAHDVLDPRLLEMLAVVNARLEYDG